MILLLEFKCDSFHRLANISNSTITQTQGRRWDVRKTTFLCGLFVVNNIYHTMILLLEFKCVLIHRLANIAKSTITQNQRRQWDDWKTTISCGSFAVNNIYHTKCLLPKYKCVVFHRLANISNSTITQSQGRQWDVRKTTILCGLFVVNNIYHTMILLLEFKCFSFHRLANISNSTITPTPGRQWDVWKTTILCSFFAVNYIYHTRILLLEFKCDSFLRLANIAKSTRAQT
jgi:hypothetical protein